MENNLDNKLRKTERLTKSKPIQLLFENGEQLFTFPFKIIWQEIEVCEFPAKVMFVVPKRKFKNAADRNHIRRLMKETYRLNKDVLYKTLKAKGIFIYISLIYVGKVDVDFKTMQKPMLKIFKKIGTLA